MASKTNKMINDVLKLVFSIAGRAVQSDARRAKILKSNLHALWIFREMIASKVFDE